MPDYTNEGNIGAFSMDEEVRKNEYECKTEGAKEPLVVFTLDSGMHKNVRLIKIDVEGHETYQGKPEQIKNRAMRNKARATLAKDGKVTKGDGMDVSHKKALDKGGSNKDGLKVQTDNANRSFKRDAKKNLVSEVSKRERKKAWQSFK